MIFTINTGCIVLLNVEFRCVGRFFELLKPLGLPNRDEVKVEYQRKIN